MDRSQTLELYIRSQRASGVSADIIRDQLQQNGWAETAIDAAFRNVEPEPEVAPPQPYANTTDTVRSVSAQRVSLQPLNTVPDIEQLPTRHGGAVSSDQEPATRPLTTEETEQPIQNTSAQSAVVTPAPSSPQSPPADAKPGPFAGLKKLLKRT